MFFLNYVRNELFRRRTRTILTAIGVALVVAISAISDELLDRSRKLLGEVGLEGRADHLPSDTTTGNDVIELRAGFAARHGTTVVVATHDNELAARAKPRIAMRDGRMAAPVAA